MKHSIMLVLVGIVVGCGSGPDTTAARMSYHGLIQDSSVASEIFSEKFNKLAAAHRDEKLAHMKTIDEQLIAKLRKADGSLAITEKEFREWVGFRDKKKDEIDTQYQRALELSNSYKTIVGGVKDVDKEMQFIDAQDGALGDKWRGIGRKGIDLVKTAVIAGGL